MAAVVPEKNQQQRDEQTERGKDYLDSTYVDKISDHEQYPLVQNTLPLKIKPDNFIGAKFRLLCEQVFYIADKKSAVYQFSYFLRNPLSQFNDKLDESKGGFLRQDATDQDIYIFLKQCKNRKFINKQGLQRLQHFRLRMVDFFGLLDVENDEVLYEFLDKLDEFWTIMDEHIEKIENQNMKEQAKLWMQNEQQELKKARYHEIQRTVWQAYIRYQIDFEEIHLYLNKKRIPFAPVRLIFQRLRRIGMNNRLRTKTADQIHYNIGKLAFLAYGQIFHYLDIITDLNLAVALYQNSRKDIVNKDGTFKHDYNIAFTVVACSTVAPYVIMYSSMMNSLFNKDSFKPQKFESFNCLKRMYLRLSFTVIGLLFMILLDILTKLELFLKCISFFLVCRWKGDKQIRVHLYDYMQEKFETVFNLNSFELQAFEIQKKQTQFMFEDAPMFLLQWLIVFNWLQVPELRRENLLDSVLLLQSTFTTIFSIALSLYMIKAEGRGLREKPLDHILLSMKAKQDWVPYGNRIKSCQIRQDINFDVIYFKLPPLTDLIGNYGTFLYQFNDESLNKLSSYLDQAHSIRMGASQDCQHSNNMFASTIQIVNQLNDQYADTMHMNHNLLTFTPRLRFGFSLNEISLHQFCNFIDKNHERDNQYVQQYIDFNGIDWEQLIHNSKLFNLDLKNPKIQSGKSILQVCIENENIETNVWQLKDLMILLLTKVRCDPNIFDRKNKLTLLTYCYQNKKHQSFEVLITYCVPDIDINQKNPKDQTTIYGRLFYNNSLKHYHDNGFQPGDKLQLILDYDVMFKKGSINKNIPQINNNTECLLTPIYYFIKQINNIKQQDQSSVDVDAMVKSEQFKEYFGEKEFQIKDSIEIQQMLQMLIDSKTNQQISTYFLKIALQRNGPFEKHLEMQDHLGNNFMHLMDLKYSDILWQCYMKDQKMDQAKSIIKNLLKQKNKAKLTPIQKHLRGTSTNSKALSKLFKEGLVDTDKRDTFNDNENEIIQGFIYHFIRLDKQQNVNAKDLIDRKEFFNTYKEPIKVYHKMKKRFQMCKSEQIFEKYFSIPEYEEQEEETEDLLLLDQKFEQIMIKQPYCNYQVNKLSEEDFSREYVGIKILDLDYRKQFKNQKIEQSKYYFLETVLNGLIEVFQCLDYYLDLIILIRMYYSIHTMWFTVMLFFMVCPYLTVYTSITTFQIQYINKQRIKNKAKYNGEGKLSCCETFMTYLKLFPTMVVGMMLLDLLFMIINTIMYVILILALLILPSKLRLYFWYRDQKEKMLMNTLKMSFIDFQGFLGQRTILQLQLESIPQIVLQGWIWYRIEVDGVDSKFNVNSGTILFSISMALIHMTLEVIKIRFESWASSESFYNYMVACYNARLGWIPQRDLLSQQYSQRESKKNTIQFDCKETNICCFGYSVLFELSPHSIEYLFSILSSMPYLSDQERQKTLILGPCIRTLMMKDIKKLLKLAQNRIKIIFDDEVILKLMEKDKIFFKQIQNPKRYHSNEEEEYHIVEMVALNQIQMVKNILKLKADYSVLSKHSFKENKINIKKSGITLFEIAYLLNYKEMLQLIMSHMSSDAWTYFKNKDIIHDVINQQNRGHEDVQQIQQPLILLDSIHLVTYDKLNSVTFTMKNYVQQHPQYARQLWNNLFGAYVPQIEFKSDPEYIKLIDKVNQWVNEYPEQITLCQAQDKQKLTLNLHSQFLCQFVAIRRAYQYLENNNYIDRNSVVIDLTLILKDLTDTEEDELVCQTLQLSIEDILLVYKIFYDEQERVSKEQLIKCDTIVKQMGFDKQWSTYYFNSRRILEDFNENEFILKMESEAGPMSEINIPDDILAIKELRIYKENIQDKAVSFKLSFEMPHYKGYINSELPPAEFWGHEVGDLEEENNLVLIISHKQTNYSLVNNYRFRVLNLLIKNQISGGHKISIELFNNENKSINGICSLKMYRKLD